jgi:hypothetical protein
MDPALEHVAEGGVDRALAVDAAPAGKGFGLDLDGEMAFAAAIVAGMAVMLRRIVDHGEPGRRQGRAQAGLYFGGDGAG